MFGYKVLRFRKYAHQFISDFDYKPWINNQRVARCRYGCENIPNKNCPCPDDEGQGCGIYGLFDLKTALYDYLWLRRLPAGFYFGNDGVLVGIEGYGETIVCEDGFRCENAEILFVVSDYTKKKRIKEIIKETRLPVLSYNNAKGCGAL